MNYLINGSNNKFFIKKNNGTEFKAKNVVAKDVENVRKILSVF
jgi:hypothetical protein